jgi:hypothetical protein
MLWLMQWRLPNPNQCLLAGANAHDADACAVCFTDDAVVRDEGRDRAGVAAIREWSEEVSTKYRPTVSVLDIAEVAGKTIVTGRVSGRFPGSPIDLRHMFTLKGDKIARLEITP